MDCFESNVPRSFTEEEVELFRTFLTEKVADFPELLPYYVEQLGEVIIGCGGLGLNEDQTVSLTWGIIHNRLHKQGFGIQLLQYRLQQATVLFPGNQLRLDTTQHAVGFFEKYGFHTVKYTPDGYAAGMHRYDMIRES